MAIPQWPTSLPVEPLRAGFTENIPNNILEFESDSGLSKRRPRGPMPGFEYSVSFNLSDTQRQTLNTFISETLSGGVLRFSFSHPLSGENIEVRLQPVSSDFLVSYQPKGFGWRVSLKLQVMP